MADTRVAAVRTNYGTGADGNDVCHLRSMGGTEELGRPFQFTVELECADHNLVIDNQLGQPLTITLNIRGGGRRYFSGLVSEMTYTGSASGLARYVAIVRPWIWFLTYSSDNRIFQEKTVPDIVKEVFRDHGESCKDKLLGTYTSRPYCVQYGETDFDFVHRLMEEDGIYYYFEYSDGQHELVLSDAYGSHSTYAEYDSIRYFAPGNAAAREEDHVDSWELMQQVETTKVAVDSYDFENPKSDLSSSSALSRQHAHSNHSLYEYGKLYVTANDGDLIARRRAEQEQSRYRVATGSGNVMGVGAGYLFTLENFPRDDQNIEYLVISSSYQLVNTSIESGAASGGAEFGCSFGVIPGSAPFRPPAITPKARVRGPQTAVVVGPSGDEIYTDKYGRVKVQFHWDRDGQFDENSSCWIRVSTAIAGQKWGMIAIPRIGQEVIVDFIEGDPDQPLIVGSVYNNDNMPPYALPDKMTQSGIVSRSTKSGDPKTFNEIRLEDKKGEEEFYVHAEKNYKRVVENDDVLEVGLVDKDKGDQTITIHNDRSVTLKEGNDTLDVAKKIDITAGDELKITVGQSSLVMKKNGDITINGQKLNFKFDMEVKGEAGMNMKLKAGVGMDLKATQVKVNGDGTLDLKSGGMTNVKGSMVDVNGSAMAKLKGGLTMIG